MIKLYCTWEKGVPHLTSTDIPSEVAEKLGFDYFEPGEKDDFQPQWYIEKPRKQHLPFFLEALSKNGVQAKLIKYSDEKSIELGWPEHDGYRYGFKDAPAMDAIVKKLVEKEPNFAHLSGASIKCVFRKGKVSADDHGRFELACIQLGSRSVKRYKKFDFVISTVEDLWESLKEKVQYRILFHELCHAGFCASPYIISHNIEEFLSVYKRFDVKIGEDPYLGKDELIKEIISQQEDDNE